jgi:hypothetical protein
MACNHTRVLSINGKVNDLCFTSVPHLRLERDDYPPDITGVCGGDYIDMEICLDCGTVVGFQPMSDAEIKSAMRGGDDEDEELHEYD